MLDGKSNPKMCKAVWVIKHKETDEMVFEYQTYQGNKKKAFFNAPKYAEEVLKKYIRNPENYYICFLM